MNFVAALFVLNFTVHHVDNKTENETTGYSEEGHSSIFVVDSEATTAEQIARAFWSFAAFFRKFGLNILYRQQQAALQQ
jgi:hypothetical protein